MSYIYIDDVIARFFRILSLLKEQRERPENSGKGSHNDQLPIGLTAQLVEHCTGVTKVRVRLPL